MPDESVAEWMPALRKVQATIPPRPTPTERGVGSEGRVSTVAACGMATAMLLLMYSVNHSLPSGPAAMPNGWLAGLGTGNSSNEPDVVTRPIWFALYSVNHSRPSGPEAITAGSLDAVGTANSVKDPEVETRPILFALLSVNHTLPSGPAAMPPGVLDP